ncbi:MAG: ABC transporter permease [Deltaproteobacteria bacterium]|nr:ABC transporter permease [Deltaproteobacteria bacterium]
MRRVLAVIERDVRKFSRNPVIMLMAVIMPILYLVILGNSFQGTLKGLPVALVNQDAGEGGRRLNEVIAAVEAGPKTVRVVRLADPGAAVAGVREGRFKAAILVPADFSRRMALGTGPEVGLFVDNTDAISANSVTAALTSAVGGLGEAFVPVRPDGSRVAPRRVDLYRSVDYDQTLVPGVVVMAIFMGTMITGVFNLVMDRFLGTEESILLTPVTKADIVVGLVVAGFLVTLAMATIVLVASVAITRLPVDVSPSRIGALWAILSLATLGLLSMMFLLLGRATHPRMVGVISGFLNVILFFPSGAVYPVESFPGWLRTFSGINPEYYAVHALKAILIKASPLSAVARDVGFLAAFTAATLTLAVVSFRRRL